MRAKRYIHLAPSEVITLEEGYKNITNPNFKQRCHCLLLSNEGYDMYSLKAIFRVSHPTISNWFASWQTSGIVGLRTQPGQGRKPILSSSDEELVKSKVRASPQTLKKVREELKADLQKDFSQRTLERFLKKLVEPLGKEQERV
jgi:transposase